MTVKQRDNIAKLVDSSFNWLTRIFLAANIFFLSEFYNEWKEAKKDIQSIKEKVVRLETSLEYIKNPAR